MTLPSTLISIKPYGQVTELWAGRVFLVEFMYYCWTSSFFCSGEILATAVGLASRAAASSDIALMDNGNLLISCALVKADQPSWK